LSTREDVMLTEAIAAVRAGDRNRARDLLTRLLKIDSANPDYWLWMSAVVDSERERVYCLQSVLRQDPTNRAALRGLTLFGAHVPQSAELSTALRIPHRKIIPPKRAGSGILQFGNPLTLIAPIAALLIGAVVLVIMMARPRSTGVAPTLPPEEPSATPTLESTPTFTPVPIDSVLLRTPIPTELGATPLAYFAGVAPTSTPLVGITPRPMYEAYTSAMKAFQRGDYGASIQFIEQVIDLDPNLADSYYLLAEAYRLLGRYNEAESAYRQALERNPLSAPVYYGLGLIQLQRNPDLLPEYISQAIAHDPSFLPAYLVKAQFLYRDQNWQELALLIQNGIASGANTPLLQIYLAEAQFHLGEYDLALGNALQGSAGDGSILQAYRVLGQILVHLGRFEEALSPLQTYLVYQSDDPSAWSYLGHAFYGLENEEAAEAAFNQAIALDDRDQTAHYLRGLIRMGQQRYEEALPDLIRASELGLESEELSMTLLDAHFHLQQYSSALEIIDEVLQTSGNVDFLAQCYAYRAQILEQQDPPLFEDAIVSWQAILDLENSPQELRDLAEQEIKRLGEILITPTPSPVPIEQ
jgi:tetratricopeptide (TPR) repeat protein